MIKKLCFVTGSRAEYGILGPLLREVKRDKDLALQMVVMGAHLCPEFGRTYREIERDGFSINSKIEGIILLL